MSRRITPHKRVSEFAFATDFNSRSLKPATALKNAPMNFSFPAHTQNRLPVRRGRHAARQRPRQHESWFGGQSSARRYWNGCVRTDRDGARGVTRPTTIAPAARHHCSSSNAKPIELGQERQIPPRRGLRFVGVAFNQDSAPDGAEEKPLANRWKHGQPARAMKTAMGFRGPRVGNCACVAPHRVRWRTTPDPRQGHRALAANQTRPTAAARYS